MAAVIRTELVRKFNMRKLRTPIILMLSDDNGQNLRRRVIDALHTAVAVGVVVADGECENSKKLVNSVRGFRAELRPLSKSMLRGHAQRGRAS